MLTPFIRLSLAAAALIFISGQAPAETIEYTGANGSLSADAIFELIPSTGTVKVTLTNTAGPSSQALTPADLLTAIFFDLTGGVVVRPLSAVVPQGQTILPSGNDAGAFWQYKTNIGNAALHGANSGISSTGLGVFDPNGNFGCGTGCKKLNGLDYGIVPASYDRGEGNRGVEKVPLIRSSVIFTLVGTVPASAGVDNVWFQYGTSLSEPGFGPGGEAPEPSTAILIGCGLLLAALRRAARKRLHREP